jgi:hypothetical protein
VRALILVLCGVVMLCGIQSGEATSYIPYTKPAEIGLMTIAKDIIKIDGSPYIQSIRPASCNNIVIFLLVNQFTDVSSEIKTLSRIYMPARPDIFWAHSKIERIWQRKWQFRRGVSCR